MIKNRLKVKLRLGLPQIKLLRDSKRLRKFIFTLQRYLEPIIYRLKALLFWQHRRVRYSILTIVFALIVSELSLVLSPFFTQHAYALGSAEGLLPETSDVMAKKLSYDAKQRQFNFSSGQGSTPGVAQTEVPPVSAVANADPSKGVTVTDGTNKVGFSLKPKFQLMEGKKDGDRIVYPLRDGTGWAVYTMQGIGVKEDIVLNYAKSDKLDFEYTLGLGDGMEARLEPNGSIGVYGNKLFSGEISVGSDKDADLLKKARKNAQKDTFLFSIPQPVVLEGKKKQSAVHASYSLKGDTLTVNVTNLKKGNYPISIDPTIYVVTAQQFMAGNNETNVDFDVTNKLIKKAATTGARFDSWTSSTNLSANMWGGGTVAAGGYAYSVGGRAPTSQTFRTQGASTYTVPAGVTSIDIKMWGGGGGGGGGAATNVGGRGGGAGSIQATFPVTPGEILNVYVGGGGKGGVYNTNGSDAGGGGGGGGYSSLIRPSTSTTLAIAAGGAGGGGGRNATIGGVGGPGGCTTSGTTCNGTTVLGGAFGAGATNSAGGAGGSGTNAGSAGTSLTGGAGADGTTGTTDGSGVTGGGASGGNGGAPSTLNGTTAYAGGGGGGSGYFGGGGGGGSNNTNGQSGGGGGGGASRTDASATGTPTLSIGSTSTTDPGNSSDASRNGSGQGGGGGPSTKAGGSGSDGIIVISYGSGSAPSKTVNWTSVRTDGSIIGNTSTSGVGLSSHSETYDSGNANSLLATLVQASSTGTVSTVRAHVGATSGTMAAAIYSDNGSQTAPVTPLGNSSVTTIAATTSWQTLILNNPINVTSGSYYWIITNLSSNTTQQDFQVVADGALSGLYSDTGATPIGSWPSSPTMVGSVLATSPPHTGWAVNMDITGTGGGTCTTWCTDSSYDLPSGRANYSLVTYNGFLYAMGGVDSSGTRQNTVYIAKLAANGEPRLWHPTDKTPANWVFWYTDTNLSSIRASTAAVAYNNRMYLIGGIGASAPVSSVEIADIKPNGTLSSWSSSTALSSAVYGHNAQVYNDRLYVIGGATSVGGAPVTTVQYNKINSNGTLNSWVATTSLSSARMSVGGNFSTIWGAYLYVSGGCGGVVGGGNDSCNSISSDTQVASINADGSLDTWNSLAGVTDPRVGHSVFSWRNNIYGLGGCLSQNTSTGDCNSGMTSSIFQGTVNQDGDASTVGQSVASGVAPCSGGSPTGCNLPGTTYVGNMLSAAIITNGYLYVMGGCSDAATGDCGTTSNDVAYVAISSTGQMTKPATCPGGSYQGSAWCTNSNTLPGGTAAASPVVFGGTIYLVGGLSGGGNVDRVARSTVNTDGSLGTWNSQQMSGTANLVATSVSYAYAFARANPSSASSYPGNLFIFGGCTTSSNAGCTAYTDSVYKCKIKTDGSIDVGLTNGCTEDNQQQIGVIPGSTNPGLAIMSGAVYANYIYLIGGVTPNVTDLDSVRYAKIDNNNNIVAVTGSAWVESPVHTNLGRRRAAAFGYNGYLYVLGGYDGTGGGGVIPDIEFAKINVSDGSLTDQSGGSNVFNISSVEISQRWGLTVPVSNSYAYVIGGCTVGASPNDCTARTDTIQTFQLYNNDSGAPAGYSTSANTYGSNSPTSTNANRIGVSSTILNGYIYAAGGCTGTSDCATPVNTVSYAAIDANGAIGSWTDTSATLPATRAWGKLLAAGGTLYYVGGQDTNGAAQTTIYYGTPASGNVSSWSTASNGLPSARTRFGATVWNNRLYVVGGASGTANTYVYSTAGSSNSLTIPSGVTTVNIKAWGAGGAGGNGSGSTGTGGAGGGAGFAQADIGVSTSDVLSINVGSGGTTNSGTGASGNGGGFSSVVRTGSTLIQAGGGGGGGGTSGANTGAGGNGGPGGGVSGSAGSAGTASIFNGTAGSGGGGGTASAGGTGGTAGTAPSVAGRTGIANAGGDGGGSVTSCSTAVTGTGGNGGTGAGGKGGNTATCASGGGGGGGQFGGGGGGSVAISGARGGGGGGGGSDLIIGTASNPVHTAGLGQAPGQSNDTLHVTNAGQGGAGTTATSGAGAGGDGEIAITYGTHTPQSTVYVSPLLSSGGNISSAWSTASTSFNVARMSPTAIAYANNLYVLGGSDGTNYLSDTQYSQINSSTGDAGSWTYSESLPNPLAGGDGFAANGYIYLLGGRSSANTCDPMTLVAPVSANTTIASGNNPTGIGAWYETNQRYTGSRYGNAAVYSEGKAYVLGGGCGATITYANATNGSAVTQQTAVLSQPQVAKYSIMFDTDSDVFPSHWLLNGVDNSVGARWQMKYRSMTDPTAVSGSGGADGTNCSASAMTTWGQETSFGDVTLKQPETYTAKDGSGTNTNCARYYYLNISVDSSQAFGYPDDVSRGPTITDLSLRFTADPSKRLMHGRTFVGGLQMPIDTPYYTN